MKTTITKNGVTKTFILEQPYVIEDYELTNAVNDFYGTEIEFVANLFWEGDFMNDCFKKLYFRDGNRPDYIERYEGRSYSDEELKEMRFQNEVIGFLDELIPKDYPYNYVLVDVSW